MLLASSAQTEHQVKSGLLLNVVVRKSATILELLSSENQALLIWGNSLLILNLSLHVLDSVRRLNIERDGLPCECFHEDLHRRSYSIIHRTKTSHLKYSRLF